MCHADPKPNDERQDIVSNIQRLAEQITATLGDHPENFDVDAITEEVGQTYGFDTNIDAIPSDKFWAIVQKHDTSN